MSIGHKTDTLVRSIIEKVTFFLIFFFFAEQSIYQVFKLTDEVDSPWGVCIEKRSFPILGLESPL